MKKKTPKELLNEHKLIIYEKNKIIDTQIKKEKEKAEKQRDVSFLFSKHPEIEKFKEKFKDVTISLIENNQESEAKVRIKINYLWGKPVLHVSCAKENFDFSVVLTEENILFVEDRITKIKYDLKSDKLEQLIIEKLKIIQENISKK